MGKFSDYLKSGDFSFLDSETKAFLRGLSRSSNVVKFCSFIVTLLLFEWSSPMENKSRSS